jgi:hypothetical protein
MTTDTHAGQDADSHVKELLLRRFHAGELGGAERPVVEAHTTTCARCRARLKDLADEQRRFEHSISFDRFAAGVERAARQPRRVAAPPSPTARWAFPALSLAAALVLIITVAPRLRRGAVDADGARVIGTNSIKGGGITVMIGGSDRHTRRTAVTDTPEQLAPGERIRIGYRAGGQEYLVAVSVDDKGEISALYPESGQSVDVGRIKGDPNLTSYLPDSIEFTGAGRERLIVVRSDRPLEVEAVKRAVRAAFQKAGGDLARLPSVDLPGEQFQRTFVKP